MTGTVTIHRTRYLESDIHDGDVPRDDVETNVYDELTAREAVNLISREGLSFTATGADWATDPDGSYISDCATGERTETSAHLSGFHPRVVTAIMAATDDRPVLTVS